MGAPLCDASSSCGEAEPSWKVHHPSAGAGGAASPPAFSGPLKQRHASSGGLGEASADREFRGLGCFLEVKNKRLPPASDTPPRPHLAASAFMHNYTHTHSHTSFSLHFRPHMSKANSPACPVSLLCPPYSTWGPHPQPLGLHTQNPDSCTRQMLATTWAILKEGS